ncbi:hypothetical protein CDD83_6896 [Cordyceps sp. RAO-2017]|nr:hypothetical protein CDD83_6896 [Cordyceps sp. RAO-2017]
MADTPRPSLDRNVDPVLFPDDDFDTYADEPLPDPALLKPDLVRNAGSAGRDALLDLVVELQRELVRIVAARDDVEHRRRRLLDENRKLAGCVAELQQRCHDRDRLWR